MKLTLHEIRSAVSFPAVIDVVFYKDEKETLYRLKYIEDYTIRNGIEALHYIICIGKYAPEVMEGEIIFENEEELRIMDKDYEKVYRIQKNAEKFKFLEATQSNKL